LKNVKIFVAERGTKLKIYGTDGLTGCSKDFISNEKT
jgi:hypothetical protein